MSIQESGFYYPNKIAHIYTTCIEETVGAEAMKAVYKLSGIPSKLIPPPNNMAKVFDFAYFSAIGAALEKMYGPRGERSLAMKAGKLSYNIGLGEFGQLIGASDLAFKAIPLKSKMKIGLNAMATAYNKFSDQVCEAKETEDYFIYTIYRCPMCWGRSSNQHICYAGIGQLGEGLRWVSSGRTFHIEEVACQAAGGEACVFRIGKEPLE